MAKIRRRIVGWKHQGASKGGSVGHTRYYYTSSGRAAGIETVVRRKKNGIVYFYVYQNGRLVKTGEEANQNLYGRTTNTGSHKSMVTKQGKAFVRRPITVIYKKRS